MTRPTDAVRTAVRRALALLPAESGQQLALVACSGGSDSLAAAAAAAQVAAVGGWRAGAVIVDHGLQPDSEEAAGRAAAQCTALGLHPVQVRRVEVADGAGPEAAARAARYGAFAVVAHATGASAVLLGHTLDDQAETVLLGLARGSGAGSLQGMAGTALLPVASDAPPVTLIRPLLGLSRATVAQACARWGLAPWHDPQNADQSFTRVRVRSTVMPALAAALGPGVPQALARTAQHLRDDETVLSDLAGAVLAQLPSPVACRALAQHPAAIRRRVLRLLVLQAGCPPARLTSGHLHALDALVGASRDGGDVRLPGGVHASVRCGRLEFAAVPDRHQE